MLPRCSSSRCPNPPRWVGNLAISHLSAIPQLLMTEGWVVVACSTVVRARQPWH
ncbi:hypothetical protein BDA96_06G041200 [Sorghum bicolor]|uniref:Uncharacterized protein n=1 Tax=Sorghum bicolor TaxID=4558 RepID=A0A921QP38_SORBI|nr:hypothetical protein BDA96_06G041200 [Sorghum bicolor]